MNEASRHHDSSGRLHATVGTRQPPLSAPAQRTRTFARGIWRIAAADVSCGNRVTLLRNGPSTFDAMLEAIESARERVDYEGYIFRDDEVGDQFRQALAAAAKRGVHVRVLIDWFGRLGTPRSFFRPLRTAGAQVRLFNAPGFRPWLGAVPRDHRKLLVTDASVGILGGIGIGKEWKTGILKRRRSPWRDTAVRIDGDASRDLEDSFERMWAHAEGARPKRRRLVRSPRSSHLDPQFDPPSLVGIIEGEPLRHRVSRGLQMQALTAERCIWIASAYFAPSWVEVEALAGAARDNVDVRVLVPSRFDHPWLRLVMTRFYGRLLRNGVRLWEWRGEMMHAKTAVVDGRWTRVGSTDFNVFGVAINYELDAVIEDPIIGSQAEEMFREDLEQARELVLRRRGREVVVTPLEERVAGRRTPHAIAPEPASAHPHAPVELLDGPPSAVLPAPLPDIPKDV
jgi:cardiolipin synthase A/B